MGIFKRMFLVAISIWESSLKTVCQSRAKAKCHALLLLIAVSSFVYLSHLPCRDMSGSPKWARVTFYGRYFKLILLEPMLSLRTLLLNKNDVTIEVKA